MQSTQSLQRQQFRRVLAYHGRTQDRVSRHDGRHTDFCLTSIYVNGKPGVAIVPVEPRQDGRMEIAPCFVSIADGMALRFMDGEERTF